MVVFLVETEVALVLEVAAGEVLDLLKRAKIDVETRAWPATYWLGRERRHFDADGAPAELQAAHDAFDAIEDDHAAGESLLQYFVRKGVRSRCLDVADAVYANDYGESASELGAAEVAHEQKHWTGGEDYFVLRNGTLADAAAELARGLDVRLGWPVARVYRDAAGASVRSRRDEMLRARCCVVAAPLGVLKQGAPAFSPALPPAHAEAIRRLPVANALKVAVALDRPVWPRGWWNAVCGDALFPEVWRSGERVVVGFATGARAAAVAALGAPAAEYVRIRALVPPAAILTQWGWVLRYRDFEAGYRRAHLPRFTPPGFKNIKLPDELHAFKHTWYQRHRRDSYPEAQPAFGYHCDTGSIDLLMPFSKVMMGTTASLTTTFSL